MKRNLPDPKWFIPCVIIFTLLFYSIVLADEIDPCGCTRETEDNICQAYYELKDQGFDVKVTCNVKEGENE